MIRHTLLLPSVSARLKTARGREVVLPGPERQVIAEYAALIQEFFFLQWPQRSGACARAFAVEPLADDRIGWLITNTTPYAAHVHRAGQPAEPTLFEELVADLMVMLPGAVWDALSARLAPAGHTAHPEPFMLRVVQGGRP
ncbi:MAG: hypothetical protein AAFV53_00235 [Myxococcota bacterium]